MATYFKFTKNGIEFSGFQDIRAKLKEDWNNTFGVELDYSETSPDGHHIDLETKTINSVAELIQGVCANLNRSTATGQYLEFLAAFLGIRRQMVNGEPESDASLRKRMDDADSNGLATQPGMETYLRNSITPNLSVTSNEESYVVDGIAPHGTRVTIDSRYTFEGEGIGSEKCNNYIAQKIFECKPAGGPTSGNQHGVAVSKVNKSQYDIKFSVPTNVGIEVFVKVYLYSEQAFPADGESLIESNIREWSESTFKPGTDVIPQWFIVPILPVGGIERAEVSIRKDGDPEWSGDPIRMSSEETATITKITVQIL